MLLRNDILNCGRGSMLPQLCFFRVLGGTFFQRHANSSVIRVEEPQVQMFSHIAPLFFTCMASKSFEESGNGRLFLTMLTYNVCFPDGDVDMKGSSDWKEVIDGNDDDEEVMTREGEGGGGGGSSSPPWGYLCFSVCLKIISHTINPVYKRIRMTMLSTVQDSEHRRTISVEIRIFNLCANAFPSYNIIFSAL
jgi:hypothetical protein